MLSYDEIKKKGFFFCEKCAEHLDRNHGKVLIETATSVIETNPILWRHSELEEYHATFKIDGKTYFICGNNLYDPITLKRLVPDTKNTKNEIDLYIKGVIYKVLIISREEYAILNSNGSILKDSEIEGIIYNHMHKIINSDSCIL